MTREEIVEEIEYRLTYWKEFDYSILSNCSVYTRHNQKEKPTVNDAILFLDTETSKSINREDNYVVMWTISIRVFHKNLVTLYGKKPSELAECLDVIQENFEGKQTFYYCHNLSYDWTFIRKFLFARFSYPVYQLNTRPHYPIHIEFDNGIILKDSLILFQRTLEKIANDFDVEHKKAIGKWDYDLIRNQDYEYSEDELTYAEFDTLAGAECIDVLMTSLNHKIFSMPWTATGIPRENVRKIGRKNNAHRNFLSQALSLNQLLQAHETYHGGYTHGNRNFYNCVIDDNITAYDFASSYPFVMLSEKYPSEKFMEMDDCSFYDIIEDVENAYMFKLIAVKVSLKEYDFPMPVLQYSKCIKCINPVVDNGRILEADYIEIFLTHIDAKIIFSQYNIERHICTDVLASYMDYLPRWFTDYVYSLYEDKCKLKHGDPILYGISKSKLNSCYGLTVEFPLKNDIKEEYESGEYHVSQIDQQEKYDEFCKKHSTVLNYQTGVFITAYALQNLFELGKCFNGRSADCWIYSDTDSAYGVNWDEEKINAYNENCKRKLRANNYDCVKYNGEEYWLGFATLDGKFSQMKVIGCKRYCVRDAETNELKITVAGVPKKTGVKCLENDIENFRDGFIFSGEKTGKKLHTYIFRDEIFIDENGNEIGDSIDLSPCDYQLSSVKQWENITNNYFLSEEYFTNELY